MFLESYINILQQLPVAGIKVKSTIWKTRCSR